MHYVKEFNINGVATKQVACIELPSPPNAATEGAVGVLGMDMSSPTHDVYRCVAVNGSVYTWELLSAGMSIMSATVTGEGAMSYSFSYDELIVPKNYLIKSGDLILDSEGYLYRITAIATSSCAAEYCGTHIGGIASGDKDRRLVVTDDGKLQLVTESGNVLSEIDYSVEDEETITRSSTGEISSIAVKTINDTVLRFFLGTSEDYEKLTDVQKSGLFAILTDKVSFPELLTWITEVRAGNRGVQYALIADEADWAQEAGYAYQAEFDVFKNPIHETYATIQDLAAGTINVERTNYAYCDTNGKPIHTTYAKTSDLTSGVVTVANAIAAGKAAADGNGDDFVDTYAKISDLTNGSLKVKSATSADSATTATNVGALTNTDPGANANVEFTIGNKSFSKTVNNVANATSATNINANYSATVTLSQGNGYGESKLSHSGFYAVRWYSQESGYYTVLIQIDGLGDNSIYWSTPIVLKGGMVYLQCETSGGDSNPTQTWRMYRHNFTGTDGYITYDNLTLYLSRIGKLF